MKALILQGSPNRDGSTAMLADEFARGARQAGHDVERIDVAHAGVHPCTGRVACGYGARPCVQRDGMGAITEKVLSADLLALATPLYYYGMTRASRHLREAFELGASL